MGILDFLYDEEIERKRNLTVQGFRVIAATLVSDIFCIMCSRGVWMDILAFTKDEEIVQKIHL